MSVDQLNNYLPGQNLNDLANNVDYSRLGTEQTQISVSFTASPATVTVAIGSIWELNGNGYTVNTTASSFAMASATDNYITYNESTGFSSASTVGTWSATKQGFYQADGITRTMHWYIEEETETVLRQHADGYTGELLPIRNIFNDTVGVFSVDGDTFFSIAYGASLYCAVGTSGIIFTSPDGITWTSRTSGTGNGLYSIVWGDSLFCAVGVSGTILTSPDGITWTSRTSGTSGLLRSVSYGSGFYLASGTGAKVRKSSDGITWSLALNQDVSATIYSASLSLYCGVGDLGIIYTSPDTITWTSRTSGTSENLYGLDYAYGAFFASGGSTALTSADGVTWSLYQAGATVTTVNGAYHGAGFSFIRGAVSKNQKGWSSFTSDEPLTGIVINSIYIGVGSRITRTNYA